jgi:hypothetical protein
LQRPDKAFAASKQGVCCVQARRLLRPGKAFATSGQGVCCVFLARLPYFSLREKVLSLDNKNKKYVISEVFY